MRSRAERNVQLLAHISTASGRQDDARHRAQAQSYLASISQRRSRRTHLVSRRPVATSTSGRGSQNNETANALAEGPVKEKSQAESNSSFSFIEDTQLAYTTLESQLPSSSLATAKSNVKRKRPAKDPESDGVPTPSQSAPSRNEATSKRRFDGAPPPFEERGALFSTAPQIAGPIPGNDENSVHHSSGGHPAARNETITTNETTSELPTSYSLSEVASGSLEGPAKTSERQSDDRRHPLSNEGWRGNGEPKLRGTESSTDDSARNETPSNVAKRRLPATGPSKRTEKPEQKPSDATLASFGSLSTSIQPRGPMTAIGKFSTHVTPAMDQLAQETALNDRFSPASVSRELSNLERGHWQINCSSWSLEEQISFWHALEDVIGSGRAGWGVWCSRGTSVEFESVSEGTAGSSCETNWIGPVRVYCWGEVAKHVYLMLYVASKSRVRRLGLQWLDSERTVIIQMPSSKRTD